MALDKNTLFELAKQLGQADSKSPVAYSFGEAKYSYTELNDLLRDEMNQMCTSYADFRENKNTIFALMETILDTALPKKVLDQYGMFAEIKTISQGDKAIFTQRITEKAKRRAKKYVTKVGLAGLYEVFKLDGTKLEVQTTAFGGAAQIGFEEFLDGMVQISDVLDIVMEALDEQIYYEIQKALAAAVANMPAANVDSYAGFDEDTMDKLLQIADSYGKGVIYCTFEFAAKMVPATGWVSEEMKNERWRNGHLGNYKGHQVIVLEQSFTDETNSTKVMDPSYAWIIPTGAEKPVKIVFEGQTIVDEYVNYDRSKEVQIYKKLGVGVITTNNICRYEDTSL